MVHLLVIIHDALVRFFYQYLCTTRAGAKTLCIINNTEGKVLTVIDVIHEKYSLSNKLK